MHIKGCVIIILCLIVLSISCSSLKYGNYEESPYQIVEVENYGTKGVIFPDTVSFPGFRKPGNLNERYSPSISEAKKFEEIFHKSYEEFRKTQPYYNPEFDFTGETYRNFTRQYFGYVDENNYRHMMIIFQSMEENQARKNWFKLPSYKIPGDWIIFFNIDKGKLLSATEVGVK